MHSSTQRGGRRRFADDRARARAARRRGRARLTVLCLVIVAAVAVPAGLGLSAGAHRSRAQARALAASTTGRPSGPRPAHVGSAVARQARWHPRHLGPAAGSLAQTDAVPPSAGPRFAHLMRELWDGVVHDSLDTALPAFFPQAAYVQVKAIGSASLDWSGRLVHDYRLDIAAAHSLLGRRPSDARLIRVDAPAGNGHWVAPGVCYNRVGYYEMPNSRVVYRQGGQTRSFGIASLISWRGVWYVVHLGAILRSGGSGVVDEPVAGPGSSSPSATC